MNADYFRIAAIGDLHLTGSDDDAQAMRTVFKTASAKADVLAICGDFTCHGRPDELRGLIHASADLDIPAVAVLGNHDHESDREDELVDLLGSAGIDVLDGTALVVEGVGFAGVKGFGSGFDRGVVEAFGERALKEFVEATQLELTRLDYALQALQTDTKVVLMHYAPVSKTLAGEPESIWPFLGCSRFEDAIDRAKARVVFHGHAHLGAPMAGTRGGIPVFNVALPVLRRERLDVRIWSTRRTATTAWLLESKPPVERMEL
jgi:Icc-related predicted phosphoesterase